MRRSASAGLNAGRRRKAFEVMMSGMPVGAHSLFRVDESPVCPACGQNRLREKGSPTPLRIFMEGVSTAGPLRPTAIWRQHSPHTRAPRSSCWTTGWRRETCVRSSLAIRSMSNRPMLHRRQQVEDRRVRIRQPVGHLSWTRSKAWRQQSRSSCCACSRSAASSASDRNCRHCTNDAKASRCCSSISPCWLRRVTSGLRLN